MDWKQDLYEKIAPFVADHAVLASNTSGLGINKLAEVLPEKLRSRFCGVHFFNPPRYMHLAELIPAKGTDKAVLEGLETFLRSEEHTSELQSLMRISYAVFCLKHKTKTYAMTIV